MELDANDREAVLMCGAFLCSLPVVDIQGASFKPRVSSPASERPAVERTERKRIAATKQATGATRVCLACKQSFEPRRKDQTCCSTACRHRIHTPKKRATKTPELAPATAKPDRLAAIKATARKVYGSDEQPELRRAHELANTQDE